MEVRHHGGDLCHGADGLLGEVLGVGRGEADALDAGLPDGAQQLGEARLPVDVAAIGVYVLPQERDLAHAVGHELLALGHDGLERAALLASADVRDDAVRAEVVAALHDGHPGVKALRASAGKVGGEAAALLAGVHLDDGAVVGKRLGEKLGQARERRGAEDDVRRGDVLADLLAVALRDAAADGNDPAAAGRLGSAHHGRGLAIEALVGVLTDAARHEDHDVSLVGLIDADAAALVKKAAHALGVVQVHLAAKGLDDVGLANKGHEVGHARTPSQGYRQRLGRPPGH